MDFLNILLPIVYILVGCALVWFLIELVLTIRKTRNIVTDVKRQIDPTLANVEKLTTDVQLTVDAVNLEMMRIDAIMEDVSSITDTANKAVETVNNVTSVPVDIVNSIATKIRNHFSGKSASAESMQLGENKAAVNGELPGELPPQRPAGHSVDDESDAMELELEQALKAELELEQELKAELELEEELQAELQAEPNPEPEPYSEPEPQPAGTSNKAE